MKEGWQTERLRDIAEYSIGLTYAPKDVSNTGTIVLRSSNVQSDELDLSDLVRVSCPVRKTLYVRKGDILMCSRNGSKRLVGKTAVIGDLPEEMTFGTFMTVIRSQCSPYLSWFFRSDAFRDQIGIGENTMINQITKYMLDAIRVPLPSGAEQRRIVSLLDEACAAIVEARIKAERSYRNAAAIFETRLRSVFSQCGSTWTRTTLGAVCEFENGDRGKNYPHRNEYVDIGVAWINTGHIEPDGTLSMSEMNFITREKFQSLRSGKVRPGDLVYCLRGATLGKTALVDPIEEGAVASSLVILRPSNVLDRRYLYFFLTSPTGQALIKGFENGAAQPNLGAKSVAKYPISFPTLTEQRVIADGLDELREETQRLASGYEQKMAALDSLKKSLLHEAFSGNL